MLIEKNLKYRIINKCGIDEEIDFGINFLNQLFKKIKIHLSKKTFDFEIILEKNSEVKDGFKIKIQNNKIFIISSNSEGIRCGIFYFAEIVGFRWFSPSENIIVPELPVEIKKLNKYIKFSFPYRGLHICGENHYDETVAKWMSFLKMNRKLTHHEEVEIVGDELKKLGLKPDLTVHSYSFWIPDEKYYKQYPEWFALVGSKRILQKEGGQLCLSNKKMREEFFKNIIDYIKKYPQISIIGICPNDGYGWCECENCRKLDTKKDRKTNSVNGRVADFVVDICKRVKKIYPDILIGNYSYSNFKDFYFLEKMPDNLIISFTLGGRCFKHSIDDPECPINYSLYKKLKIARQRVHHVYVYEYYIYNWEKMPSPTWEVVYKDIKAYKKLGVDGFLSEVTGINTNIYKTNHLPLYIAGKFLFNLKENLNEVMDDYCKKRFGPAFLFMKSYFNTIKKGLEKMEGCFFHKPEELEKILTQKILKKCRKFLNKALLKVNNEDFYKKEVKKEIKIFDYWEFIVKERKRYKLRGAIKSKKVDEINLNLKTNKSFQLLDKQTLIPPIKNKSFFEIYSNEKEVGFLIDCYEEKMKNIIIKKGHNLSSVYGSDNLEIFIAGPKKDKIYHFIINPEGYFCVSECYNRVWNWSWKGKFEIKTKKFSDKWQVLLKISKEQFKIKDSLFFTIIRNRHTDNKWEITGFPSGGVFFDVKAYTEVNLK
ncbi:MAG: DUF4838 domain-containing protein [Candidatus Aenigmatarchaeota archaeon]